MQPILTIAEVSVVAWLVVAVAGVVVGGHLTAAHPEYHTNASPFHGRWDLVGGRGVLLPLVAGIVLVVAGPVIADRLPWRRLLLGASVAAFGWAIALAATVGAHGITDPMREHGGYLQGVGLVDGDFLRTFTSNWREFPVHVKGHPPGLVLLLWLLDRIGLGGAGWAALLLIAAGASAVAAVLVVVRNVAGEATARRIAPFLVLTPAAVWIATSGDALFAAAGAWAVALTVAATTRGRGWAVAAGAGWGVALMLSYGLVLLAPVAAVVAWRRRRVDVLVVCAASSIVALVVVGLATGFWWPAGVAATRRAYQAGYAAHRSAAVFLWLNLCAFAIAVGPAVAPALARLRRHAVAGIVIAALTGVLIADASLLSKAEVERIWLPWVPWLLVATAALPRERRRMWLAGQAGTGFALQLALRSTW